MHLNIFKPIILLRAVPGLLNFNHTYKTTMLITIIKKNKTKHNGIMDSNVSGFLLVFAVCCKFCHSQVCKNTTKQSQKYI